MKLWILIRQRDATREVALKLCQFQGEPVSRDLLPTAPPLDAACGRVSMTREERICALGCMGRAMIMHELAHGAGMPGALDYAAAHKATTAMRKRDAAARAPPFHPCHAIPFSGRAEHTAPDIVLSTDRLTVTRRTRPAFAWARSEFGVGAGCGVVRWAVQLSKESGDQVFCVGVASDAFIYTGTEAWPKQSWYFCDSCMFADGQPNRDLFNPRPFTAGDVVTVELERAPGVDGVLRVLVAGKMPRELRGLPSDGVLYPIVCLSNEVQSISMVAVP